MIISSLKSIAWPACTDHPKGKPKNDRLSYQKTALRYQLSRRTGFCRKISKSCVNLNELVDSAFPVRSDVANSEHLKSDLEFSFMLSRDTCQFYHCPGLVSTSGSPVCLDLFRNSSGSVSPFYYFVGLMDHWNGFSLSCWRNNFHV